MRKTVFYSFFAVLMIVLVGCGTATKKSILLEPGLSKQNVLEIMGTPENRSFKDQNEAWQYQEVVGFGQCSYVTVWFRSAKVVSVTSRSGPSVAGCGLGSREVDWGQMPKPSLDLNINMKTN
jgi:hypothetical protein